MCPILPPHADSLQPNHLNVSLGGFALCEVALSEGVHTIRLALAGGAIGATTTLVVQSELLLA